jgi:hypothetical protein
VVKWPDSKPFHNIIFVELNMMLYSLPSFVRVVKSKRMRWTGHVVCMGEERDVHRVLVGKSEGKRPLGRPRCRWEDNINMSSGSWRGLWGLDGVGSRW